MCRPVATRRLALLCFLPLLAQHLLLRCSIVCWQCAPPTAPAGARSQELAAASPSAAVQARQATGGGAAGDHGCCTAFPPVATSAIDRTRPGQKVVPHGCAYQPAASGLDLKHAPDGVPDGLCHACQRHRWTDGRAPLARHPLQGGFSEVHLAECLPTGKQVSTAQQARLSRRRGALAAGGILAAAASANRCERPSCRASRPTSPRRPTSPNPATPTGGPQGGVPGAPRPDGRAEGHPAIGGQVPAHGGGRAAGLDGCLKVDELSWARPLPCPEEGSLEYNRPQSPPAGGAAHAAPRVAWHPLQSRRAPCHRLPSTSPQGAATC